MSSLALRLVLVPLLALGITSAFAQRSRDTYGGGSATFEITGQVRVAETGEPGTNITVNLQRFSGGNVDQINTDNNGRFRFTNLQRGYYRVVAKASGFSPAQQEADLQVFYRAYLAFDLISLRSKGSIGSPGPGDVIDARVPADARQEFVLGRSALARKSESEAITHLQKAISIYSDFFDATLLLATALMDAREWEKAEGVLRRALDIKPENPPVLIYLGETYWRQKRYTDAEKTLLEGLRLDEGSWHGQFTLARLYWDMGDVMKSGPPLGRALQLKPDFAEAHLLAGNVLLRVGQQQRALVEYQEYLRLAPTGEFVPSVRELALKLEKSIAEKK